MAIARRAAADIGFDLDFTIIGMADAGPQYVSESDACVFKVDTRALISPVGCWKVLGRQDCVLDIGAGDSFADIYGPKRFAFLWLTKMIALARRRPLMLSPQTIGPFTREPYVTLARAAMERAWAVVARDGESMDFLRRIAPRAYSAQAVDVAFALPFDDRRSERGRDGKLQVGVNVSGLLFNEAAVGSNRFGLSINYANLMRRFVGDLCQRGDVTVHLVAHANGLGLDDDRAVADLLAAEFPQTRRVPDFESPSDAKSYISGLDFLVAGRMHACIAAFSAGTPVVPIAYSRKFSGLFGTLSYPWMVPVTGMSTDEALSYLHAALEQRAALGRDESNGMSKVDALLEVYRSELRAMFCQVGVRG
jgi:polysaccharide pyruvyl transferase WcaK-like protein